MGIPDASRLLLLAGRDVLGPFGLTTQGRGRNWIDDHGWWVVNVEFQPSGSSKGSYLNVGVQWLWKPIGAGAFEYGYRVPILVNGKSTDFVEFESASQFEQAAQDLVKTAAGEVLKYRELFRTLTTTINVLHRKEPHHRYHLAVAYALIGKDHEARRSFSAARVNEAPRAWEIELNELMDQLASLTHDMAAFRARVLEIVIGQRRALKLNQDSVDLPDK
jgi:hypothetical protein